MRIDFFISFDISLLFDFSDFKDLWHRITVPHPSDLPKELEKGEI